jgi:hypothetical protein
MGKELEELPEKQPAKWSPFRLFKWIDSHPSESRRRITQNLISGLVVATIVAVCGIIWNLAWTHKDILTKFPKWFFDLLQSPIQLKLWILLLALIILFGVAWFVYWIRGKIKKIAELEAQIVKHTPQTTDEILEKLYQQKRKTKNLVTKSWYYPKIEPNKEHNGRNAHVKIEAANDSERPIILTELVAEYDDGSCRSIYVYGQTNGNNTQGVQLKDQERHVVDMDDLQYLIVNPDTDKAAKDFWFVDSLGNKYPVKDAKQNLELYFKECANEFYKSHPKPR